MTKITVYDACCGSGKSTRIIEELSKLPDEQKIIVVVPLLSETHRYAGTDPDSLSNNLLVMDDYDKTHPLYLKFFKHPLPANSQGSKLIGLDKLIEEGNNIVTTHALFRNLTPDMLAKIKEQNYKLVIDEVLTTYEEYDGLADDLKRFLECGILFLDEDGITLRWKDGECKDLSRYQQEICLCDNGSLLLVDNKIVLWEMPKDILCSFKEIIMATYMFEGSYMAGYLKYHNLNYDVVKFGKSGKEFKHLINIVEDVKLNECGDKNNALSRSHQLSNIKKETMLKVKKNLYNYFNAKYFVPKEQRLWTCYKSTKAHLTGKGYAKNFLSLGTKATNEYRETSTLAFVANLFTNPMIDKLLAKKNITVSESDYAIGELIQWIYRSRIRCNEPITIYIPSRRMRELLKDWLDGKFD